jgi:hypothetical protein
MQRQISSGSFFNAQDRFSLSMKAIASIAKYESERAGRKLTIWISPGWPFFSGENLEFGPKDWQEIFKTIVGTSEGLRHARTTIYSIDPTGVANAGQTQVTYYQQFLKPATSASHGRPCIASTGRSNWRDRPQRDEQPDGGNRQLRCRG